MIIIKTQEQITKIKKSCAILIEVKKILFDKIQIGISTEELDQIAFKEIIKRNAKPAFLNYSGFPKTTCISINDEMIHGIPGPRVIKDGDIVKIDLGVIWKGYYSDSAFTKGVGNIKKSDKKLIQIAKNAFYAGFNAIKPGARVGDISNAIETYVKSQGMFLPENFTGHGIGKALHEEPQIHNIGSANTGPLLKNGMTICIEPMILQKSKEVIIMLDGWTVVSKLGENTAHYEHTILIQDGHPKILTGGI